MQNEIDEKAGLERMIMTMANWIREHRREITELKNRLEKLEAKSRTDFGAGVSGVNAPEING